MFCVSIFDINLKMFTITKKLSLIVNLCICINFCDIVPHALVIDNKNDRSSENLTSHLSSQ